MRARGGGGGGGAGGGGGGAAATTGAGIGAGISSFSITMQAESAINAAAPTIIRAIILYPPKKSVPLQTSLPPGGRCAKGRRRDSFSAAGPAPTGGRAQARRM